MNFKHQLRQCRLALGKLLIDQKKNTEALLQVNSILFLRQDGKIGDYIVSSFIFRELKKLNPNIIIGVVCTKQNEYLFRQNPYIDHFYVIKKRSIFNRITCGLILRKQHYDVLIDPTVTLRNRDLLFIRLINAKLTIGYQKETYNLFNVNIPKQPIHFSQIYQQALKLIGYHNINTQYDIPFEKDCNNHIKNFLASNNITHYIALNLYGNGSARRFNFEKANRLLQYLTQHCQYPILLLNNPEMNSELQQLASNFNRVFIDNQSNSIFYAIEYIRHCDLLISPDTSTVHIAVGLNKPIIAFYNQDQENFAHWQPNSSQTTHILRYQNTLNDILPESINPNWLL